MITARLLADFFSSTWPFFIANFLMNDDACRNAEGDLHATPFSVQFGKKDIWLPRYGTPKSIRENI